MGNLIKIILVTLCIVAIANSTTVFADLTKDTIESFVAEAKKRNLHSQASWHDLLHYRPNILTSGYTSQADSANFFFAKNGKVDPEAELTATIRAMFTPILLKEPDLHPQCLFVARKNWLIKKLPTLKNSLPLTNCTEYQEWINSIDPHSVTLAFPAAYINNPGSMFGHTLLRIDPPKSKQKNFLTSYAITYAANTNEVNGLAFAIKGLAGGYPGLFAIVPYYDKVNEYNDLENRDIWEYQLNLTPEESQRMLQHMWELRSTVFDYYFLDENCSYQLLALLDVARPGLNLAAEFPREVIPADTVRSIIDKKLVSKIYYRPSLLTDLKYQLENFSGDHLQIILDLVNGVNTPDTSELNSLSEKEKIIVLEIAYNFLQYRYKSNEIVRKDYAKRSLLFLKARNKLDPEFNVPSATQPEIRPEQGHKSSRMTFTYGNQADQDFLELNWRPSYHDLLDNNDGFVDGLQINFGDLYARINTTTNKLYLQRFDFFSIYSLKPRNQFFKPVSWKFNIGYQRLPVVRDRNTLVFNINTGGGVSYQIVDSIRLYGLVEVTLLAHRRFKNSVSAAIGPNLGLFWQLNPDWKIWLDTKIQYYDNNNKLNYQRIELAQSYSITKDQAIRLHFLQEAIQGGNQNEIKASLVWYY